MATATQQTREILTLREAADFLRISDRTAWGMAKAGELPSFRAGSQLRFLRPLLRQWAESGGSERKGVNDAK
jgi:excisionase family DNA binding protein